MAIWAELPVDLLLQIANRVKVMEDFIALRGVCTSWRAAITNDNFDMLLPQVPLLMLGDNDNNDNKYREFYSLSRKKVSRIFLPEVVGRDCVSSKGWLCTMSYKGDMKLLHPFSRTQIRLPSLKSLLASHGVRKVPKRKEYPFIQKAVLSVSPSVTSSFVLMVSVSVKRDYFAFWRPGDLKWTPAKTNGCYKATMACHKGQFYGVTNLGQLWVFDFPGPIVQPRSVVLVERNFDPLRKYYLVEKSNALLIVKHIFNGDRSGTFRFEVFEFDTIKSRLNEIRNLGDSTIFLSSNGGSCINISEFRGLVKPNHIYFTDDLFKKYKCSTGERYMWAYNLEDGKFESFYPGSSSIYPLTWVAPSFRQCDYQTKRNCCLF